MAHTGASDTDSARESLVSQTKVNERPLQIDWCSPHAWMCYRNFGRHHSSDTEGHCTEPGDKQPPSQQPPKAGVHKRIHARTSGEGLSPGAASDVNGHRMSASYTLCHPNPHSVRDLCASPILEHPARQTSWNRGHRFRAEDEGIHNVS